MLHSFCGKFSFKVIKTKQETTNKLSFFDKKSTFGSSHFSQRLILFGLKYATKMSYKNTETLLSEVCFGSFISDRTLQNLVAKKAQEISLSQQKMIDDLAKTDKNIRHKEADFAEQLGENTEEYCYFCDDVLVKFQKETRDKTSLQPAQVAEQLGTDLAKESVIMPQIPKDDSFKENVCVKRKEKGRKFSSVRVGMLENLEGKFLTIISGFGINHIAHTQAVLQNTFKNKSLKIVAITDGATSIKNDLAAMFGENYTHILDWYHLEKKVYQTMSMVSEKGKKDEDCKKILHHLWHGKVEQAISYLHTIVAKQEDKKAMLITYFTKNKLIIIDYDGRKKQNKTIGSGRCEKQNDVLVAKRQKNNTMAWSENGSLALALVTQYFNENQG